MKPFTEDIYQKSLRLHFNFLRYADRQVFRQTALKHFLRREFEEALWPPNRDVRAALFGEIKDVIGWSRKTTKFFDDDADYRKPGESA